MATPPKQSPKSSNSLQNDKQQAASSPPAKQASGPTNEQISKRAYEIYQARGGSHGRHEDDWKQAERELKLGRQ